ncbi:glycosyltransferase family 2 protein [Gregarina niphandrodes]|uniref:Glycosyltransferase family 2 protein n=1 Tax=Gregarina niphandrodes TaxID=110365 RepID=A0A023AXX0_GRENI|nr:glycosyltransferase family 2 protein [Gregarina niphandrodes]EZG43313.1 glycosyltransferase family 2 protein [Gregarina niphandrodes]|eukprot:XP_011133432.1 glycosyltransferase family 2 protein [Gregarina niphandrodes]
MYKVLQACAAALLSVVAVAEEGTTPLVLTTLSPTTLLATTDLSSSTLASVTLPTYLAKGLPSYNYVTDVSNYFKSLRWVFDSASEEPVLDTTMILANGTSEAEAEDGRLMKMRSMIDVWRNISEVFHEVGLKDRETLDDVCLMIPVGARKLNNVWPSMESMLNIRKVPGEILFITGLEPSMREEERRQVKTSLMGNLELLKEQYIPNLPKNVRLRWGVYDGPGGPSVSRWMGSAMTDKEYYMIADGDDMIGLDAIEFRRALMEKYPEVKQVLTSYTNFASEFAYNLINLDREWLANDPTKQMKITFMDIAEQLMQTRIDVEYALSLFRFDEAEASVSTSYKKTQTKEGSLVGWPQLQFLPSCDEMIEEVKKLDKSGLSDEQLVDEAESVAWLEKKCNAEDEPEYVLTCANGWAATRTETFRTIPPTVLTFGEDSLTNWIISTRTRATVCVEYVSSGLYFKGFDNMMSKIFPEY